MWLKPLYMRQMIQINISIPTGRITTKIKKKHQSYHKNLCHKNSKNIEPTTIIKHINSNTYVMHV